MRRMILVAIMFFSAVAAQAQERAVDGVLGGVAGAVVLGPLGLLGGAVIGATAGPGISQSWGLSGSASHRRYHHRRSAPHA